MEQKAFSHFDFPASAIKVTGIWKPPKNKSQVYESTTISHRRSEVCMAASLMKTLTHDTWEPGVEIPAALFSSTKNMHNIGSTMGNMSDSGVYKHKYRITPVAAFIFVSYVNTQHDKGPSGLLTHHLTVLPASVSCHSLKRS